MSEEKQQQLPHMDLTARAKVEMTAQNFVPDFEAVVLDEVNSVKSKDLNSSDVEDSSENVTDHKNAVKDLRNLLWSSIDNAESRDLDQIEYAERLDDEQIRIMVAIADVDSFVPKGSACDKHAFENTTSVYTGVAVFPMLPDAFSFDLTSLLPEEDRLTIVIEMVIDKAGTVVKSDVYQALTRNHAKLDYVTVGNWLSSGGPAPQKISAISNLTEQLLLQDEAKEKIKDLRQKLGSLQLQTNEATTIASHGQVIGLELVEDNRARDLIENFMIAANISVSKFLEGKDFASLRRVVKTPQRWDKIVQVARSYGYDLAQIPDAKSLAAFLLERKEADPVRFPDLSLTIVKLLGRGEYVVEVPGQADIGHFALAVHDYTHATAPNRRFTDLVTQRLIKAAIKGKTSPYSTKELEAIAKQCTDMESASNKVERTMRKVSAAVLLSKHIGETFDAIVTGVKGADVFVRLFKPPAEGMVIEGGHGSYVGQKIEVKLLSTDVEKAFVDFAKVH